MIPCRGLFLQNSICILAASEIAICLNVAEFPPDSAHLAGMLFWGADGILRNAAMAGARKLKFSWRLESSGEAVNINFC